MYPYVSVIMPIFNEEGFIQRSLGAVLAQDYPVDRMELLVVDGMSTDGTRTIIEKFALLHPRLKIQILDNSSKIVPTGLNIALRLARGEIIIRVDGHTLIALDYVSNCVEHIKRDAVDGVGGFVNSFGETNMAKAIANAMSTPFGVGNSAMRTKSGMNILADTVPFPAYTRRIIERAGLYDEELVRNQDDEYNYRIRKLGGKILLASDVNYIYFTRTTLKGLWQQYFQYGYWKVRVLQKHPHQMSLRQFVPPAFVFMLFISMLMAFFSSSRTLSLLLPLMYILANLSASLWTAARRGWRSLPYLPVIFAVLHLSYGLGFLAGLVKFWNRWSDKVGKTPIWSDEAIG